MMIFENYVFLFAVVANMVTAARSARFLEKNVFCLAVIAKTVSSRKRGFMSVRGMYFASHQLL